MTELESLIAEFNEQPMHLRRNDLVRINELRQTSGLPPLGMNLKPIDGEATKTALKGPKEPQAPLAPVDPWSEQREIWQQYLTRCDELEAAQRYCDKVMMATQKKHGRTPVEPLATMGNDGGQLVCDQCGEGFLLEGGHHNNVLVADAWQAAGRPVGSDWSSWIRGHITFMVEANGTIRVYHGEASHGRTYGCGKLAEEADAEARNAHQLPDYGKFKKLMLPFAEEKLYIHPKGPKDLVRDIYFGLYNYDPGLGVNHG